MNRPNSPLRLGSRGSPLALAQAEEAAAALRAAHGWDEEAVAIVVVTTTGDKVQDRPLAEIGGKSLWTKELDRALLAGEVDACVHSMKDVESERPTSIRIAAMLERADVRDRLVGAPSIEALAHGARVGTSSPRRTAQLLRRRPDLRISVIRGNVATRLRKVADRIVDATLLAAAGLDRLGLDEGAAIDTGQILPAPGQAAIGVECRADDRATLEAIAKINHRETFECVIAERAFTRALGGTCSSPVAALARIDAGQIAFEAQILSADGNDEQTGQIRFGRGDDESPADLGRAMLAAAPPSIARLFEAP